MAGTRHGPELGLSWLDQEVRSYREKGRSPTAMRFSEFERNSLVARASYRITFEASSETLGIRPYAAVAYETELDGDPVSVTAESNTMAAPVHSGGVRPARIMGERRSRRFHELRRASERSPRLLRTNRRRLPQRPHGERGNAHRVLDVILEAAWFVGAEPQPRRLLWCHRPSRRRVVGQNRSSPSRDGLECSETAIA